jgi:site-specific recombinase XerD
MGGSPTSHQPKPKGWRMKLSKAIQQFVDETRMGKSKATAVAYGSDLHPLNALARPDSVLSFNEALVTSYFLGLSQQGLAMSSLRRKAGALRQFGYWGQRLGLWHTNPLLDPKFKFRAAPVVPRPFAADEVARLMALTLPPVEHAARALLYHTGLRVSPICGLKVGDISFAPVTSGGVTLPGTCRTLNKGAKTQVVPIVPELRDALAAYLQLYPGLRGHDPLLWRNNGHPWNRGMVELATQRWGLAAGVANCTPHRFRHTLATDMLRRGVALPVIQAVLGHASITSTLVYTKVADDQVMAAMLLAR